MPQGGMKIKTPNVPNRPKKNKKKDHGLKKGSRSIAPKKAKAVESQVVKKQLQKAINANIEESMKARASHETNFKLFKKDDLKKSASSSSKK